MEKKKSIVLYRFSPWTLGAVECRALAVLVQERGREKVQCSAVTHHTWPRWRFRCLCFVPSTNCFLLKGVQLQYARYLFCRRLCCDELSPSQDCDANLRVYSDLCATSLTPERV
uniref:Uncharacterized protein n=1 Tax=Cuerna arida TaxID=1464854 RepID=A0A1B6FDQ4_9HEMI